LWKVASSRVGIKVDPKVKVPFVEKNTWDVGRSKEGGQQKASHSYSGGGEKRRGIPRLAWNDNAGAVAHPSLTTGHQQKRKADPSPPFARNATGFGMTIGVLWQKAWLAPRHAQDRRVLGTPVLGLG
jgi:hypothetical protein